MVKSLFNVIFKHIANCNTKRISVLYGGENAHRKQLYRTQNVALAKSVLVADLMFSTCLLYGFHEVHLLDFMQTSYSNE